jgi:hypothetical protein
LKDTVEFLLKSITGFPEQVKIKEVSEESMNILEISVDPSDIGKVIGKQGKVIKAIRTILKAATITSEKKTIIKIVE